VGKLKLGLNGLKSCSGRKEGINVQLTADKSAESIIRIKPKKMKRETQNKKNRWAIQSGNGPHRNP